MSQSDTRTGTFRVLAGENLTDKKGFLAVLTHDTGVPEVKLPASISAYAFYLVDDDGADAAYVDVEPLEAGRNVRAVLKGTCNPGDVLVLADTDTAADKGKVRVLPAAAGTYRVLAIAEEKGVDGQRVLCRPAMIGLVTVSA
jgi:hypothetical protein